MNIFYVDQDPVIAARSLINIHTSKMCVESAQLLANCYSSEELEQAPRTQKGEVRKHSYFNHPCAIWVRESLGNWRWLKEHATELYKEKLYRTGELHFCYEFIDWCYPPNLPKNGLTKPALCVKICPDLGDPVLTYRNYYVTDKRTDKNNRKIDYYTRRERPDWFPEL